jgi:hypothetical protein
MQTLLMLRREGQPLFEIERYLSSHGYNLIVASSMADAVRIITTERPEFALLSAELIPRRSAWLIGILGQLTGIVLFVERISARTLAISRELKDTSLLEPPLTPFGTEQLLRRVERDQQKLLQNAPALSKTHVWIMSALSDLALRALCTSSPSEVRPEAVERTTRITCFRAETSKIAGYFIMAYGQGRSLPAGWTARLQSHLRESMQTFDHTPLLDSSEEIQIQEVNFKRWSKAQAEFISQAAHDGGELALAFFKDQAPVVMKPSTRPDHIEIGLDSLRGDSVVDFDVYIYLPQNARYVLYAARGGLFEEKQKQKLQAENVRSVHVHKRSLDELLRHRAHKFIAESSEAFR